MPAKLWGSSAGVADYFIRKLQRINRRLKRNTEIVVLFLKFHELFKRWLAPISLASSPVCRAIDGQTVQKKPSKK
jgi:hypothetical protein